MEKGNFESSFEGFSGMEDVMCHFSDIEENLDNLKIEQGAKEYFTSLFCEFKEVLLSEENDESIQRLKDISQKLMDFAGAFSESKDESKVRFSALVFGVAFKVLYRLSQKTLED
jgi:hypothetical protein